MTVSPERKDGYHHGALRETLVRLGLVALERDGADSLSLRSLAEAAGVSKTAPYRHFHDRDDFLGALVLEGFRLLHGVLATAMRYGGDVGDMGRAYMQFAVEHPALYRLMHSPLLCRASGSVGHQDTVDWPRKAFMYLADVLGGSRPDKAPLAAGERQDVRYGSMGEVPDAGRGASSAVTDGNAATAAWAYIHGLALIRIDHLYPDFLPEPDWDALASAIPVPSGV